MGKKSKKEKKSKKSKKDHKKKKHRSRSSSHSSSSSTASSRSPSRERSSSRRAACAKTATSAVEAMTNYFKDQPKTDYYLAQKSEMLLFDKSEEPEDKNETFVWRKKDKKIGVDKLDPQKKLVLNQLKQEETARELEKLKRRKIEREREREELDRERVSFSIC